MATMGQDVKPDFAKNFFDSNAMPQRKEANKMSTADNKLLANSLGMTQPKKGGKKVAAPHSSQARKPMRIPDRPKGLPTRE